MNIAVSIKQVPVPAQTHFDEKTKTLVREGVDLAMSSLDRRALLEAIRLRSETGGAITVLTMGPPQARSVLEEGLALGADRAIHLSDPLFAGADTLATSRALAAALQRLDPDLILCGKFTIDSETGQVPSEIAELLGWPQVTSVLRIRPTEHSDVLWAEREMDEGYEQYQVTLSTLMSVVELVINPRRPTPEELEGAQGKPTKSGRPLTWGSTPLCQELLVPQPGSPSFAQLAWSAAVRSFPVRTPRKRHGG